MPIWYKILHVNVKSVSLTFGDRIMDNSAYRWDLWMSNSRSLVSSRIRFRVLKHEKYICIPIRHLWENVQFVQNLNYFISKMIYKYRKIFQLLYQSRCVKLTRCIVKFEQLFKDISLYENQLLPKTPLRQHVLPQIDLESSHSFDIIYNVRKNMIFF